MQKRDDTAHRRVHNIAVVQSREGWTMADVMKAIADAEKGIRYERYEKAS